MIYRASIRYQTTDLWYIVINLYSGKKTLTPIGMKWSNTLIWLNDYNQTPQIGTDLFIKDSFYAKNTRIVIPAMPSRAMNYKLLGDVGADIMAWYNMN